MLDAADYSTIGAVRRLHRVVRRQERPVVFWIGAGVSVWAGYPLWSDLADIFHSTYLRTGSEYDRDHARELLTTKQFPDFFSLCRTTDRDLYFRLLTEHLSGRREGGPIYHRFCQLLTELRPLRILTTNVDESLESHLRDVHILQRSDFQRVADLDRRGESFLCKLHGTISAVSGAVFTREDYEDLLADDTYHDLLVGLFNGSSVVFLGYSLAEEYVLKALRKSTELMSIVGSGPHFVIADSERDTQFLPDNIHTIRYRVSLHQDHRSTLQVLDILGSPKTSRHLQAASTEPKKVTEPLSRKSRSAFYIADIYPPGTWTTSQDLNVTNAEGKSLNVLVGQGFDNWEVGKQPSKALHDLAIGLLCFDTTYVPLSALVRVHDLLGSARFWRLHQEDALRFVHLPSVPGIIYPTQEAPTGGDLAMITLGQDNSPEPQTAAHLIGKALSAMPGRETEARALFESLDASTISLADEEGELPSRARAALLHPRLQQLLGMSDATRLTSLPRWQAFPALRVLHGIQAAEICTKLGIPTLKIPFGVERLVSAIIGVGQPEHSADEVAGYLILQRATGDLTHALEANHDLFDLILRFRATAVGQELRSEVFAALDIPQGTEFEAAVSAGLRKALPPQVMDNARDQFEELMVPRASPVRPSRPAVWADTSFADEALRRWRIRARKLFEECCEINQLGPYDECPCGSQEKVKFCCQDALRD